VRASARPCAPRVWCGCFLSAATVVGSVLASRRTDCAIYSHCTELDVQRLPLERLTSLTRVLFGTRRDGPIACRAIL
jgi:hypothetical protein